MILVNKKEVTLDNLQKVLSLSKPIPLDKLTKKPLFEINPAMIVKDPANGAGAVKCRNSMEFPAWFMAKTKSGESLEIRFCKTRKPDPKTNGNSEVYSPKTLEFDGRAEFVKDDLDKAVYFWLHFFNKNSPFRLAGVPYDYDLVDDDARADDIIQLIELRSRATSHAAALTGDAMLITAKGIKIDGASTLDAKMVKAMLMQYAQDRPAEYLNAAESRVNQIRGLIFDAVDKEIFVVESLYNSKRWKWGKGVRSGELIVEMSSNIPDEKEALFNFISENFNEYYPVLVNVSKTVNASKNLQKALENVDVMKDIMGDVAHEKEEPIDPGDEDDLINSKYLPMPTSFKEAQEYMGKHAGTKAPAIASDLMDKIKKEIVTIENIDLFIAEVKEQRANRD